MAAVAVKPLVCMVAAQELVVPRAAVWVLASAAEQAALAVPEPLVVVPVLAPQVVVVVVQAALVLEAACESHLVLLRQLTRMG